MARLRQRAARCDWNVGGPGRRWCSRPQPSPTGSEPPCARCRCASRLARSSVCSGRTAREVHAGEDVGRPGQAGQRGGRSSWAPPWVARRPAVDIGYLPELFRYQPWLSVAEVLGLHARLRPVPAADRAGEVRRVLGSGGPEPTVGRTAWASLSKGLQQRLRPGCGPPRGGLSLLLLDEPTSALDPTGRADVRSLIDECRAEGTTVLLNSHMLSEVERSCDRVIVLDRGRVLADGPLGAWLDHDMLRVRLDSDASPFRARAWPASGRCRLTRGSSPLPL